MHELEALSPLDGRYRKTLQDLVPFFSERAFFQYRIIVECEYLLALSEHPKIDLRSFTAREKNLLRSFSSLPLADFQKIKKIESATRHDVKAVEYFLKEKLKKTSLKDCLEWIHFSLTSEDTNNLAYALMLSEGVKESIVPTLKTLSVILEKFALKHQRLPMLARTHGQPASPTTLGKEFRVFQKRLDRQLTTLRTYHILAKLNGATGNYNAHRAAYPKINWPAFTKKFIQQLNGERKTALEANLVTTQIEPHDTYAELFDILRRINIILIDFNQDIWRYISDGWMKQKVSVHEIGSSTMPHKVNPIDFENSEGNLGVANALFSHFSHKLPISRLQRDLSDSTVERNFGAAFGYSLLGYRSILRGLEKIDSDEETLTLALEEHPEVLGELLQTIFRREGLEKPYEQLKQLTRGKKVTKEILQTFVDSLPLEAAVKKHLKRVSPKDYLGLAGELAKKEF